MEIKPRDEKRYFDEKGLLDIRYGDYGLIVGRLRE